MISCNGFAVFRKKGWPDLGPIPVKVRPGGSRGSINGGNFLEFDYTVSFDTAYVFRASDGTSSQIDGTCSILHPDYNNGDPMTLNIPRRSVRFGIASANFNLESPS